MQVGQLREVNHSQGQQLASVRAHMESQTIAQGEQLASARAHMESQAIARGEQLASARAHMESQAIAAAAQQQQVGFTLMYLTLCLHVHRASPV